MKRLWKRYQLWGRRQSYRHNCRTFGFGENQPMTEQASGRWSILLAESVAARKRLKRANIQFYSLLWLTVGVILAVVLLK